MSNDNNIGISITGLLTVLFVALKLLEKITWSWFLVLSPLWISILIYLVCIVVAFIYFLFFSRRF